MDDILVWGVDRAEHDRRLKKVLDRVREYNLKLSIDKCEFRKDEVTYVGHRFNTNGVKPDPEKVRVVELMQKPTCVKELKTFIGFVQYLGKFMPNFSEVSAPLRILLEKNTAGHWRPEQDDCFHKLKIMAINAPVLKYYDSKKKKP